MFPRAASHHHRLPLHTDDGRRDGFAAGSAQNPVQWRMVGRLPLPAMLRMGGMPRITVPTSALALAMHQALEDDRRKGLAGGLAIGCSTVAAAAVRHYAVRWPVFSTSSKSWPHPSIGVDVLRRTPLHGEPNGGGSVLGRHVGDTRHTCTCSRTENVDVLYMHLFSYQAC